MFETRYERLVGNVGSANTLSSSVALGRDIKALARKYPLDASGRFGTKDIGSQVIFTENPLATAQDMVSQLTNGGKLKLSSTDSVKIFKFPGTKETVVFRPQSDHGSPAISINSKSHFGREY